MAGVRIPAEATFFSIQHPASTASGDHATSCPIGTVGPFLEVKLPGREADHSPPCGTEVKNGGALPPFLICLCGRVLN
jgi:hypothetical protein